MAPGADPKAANSNAVYRCAFFILLSSENPLWGGADGVAFGVGSMVRDNPPLRPSRGAESHSFHVVPIFMLCGAGHPGMDGSPENPPYQGGVGGCPSAFQWHVRHLPRVSDFHPR